MSERAQDGRDAATREAMLDPQPGDEFHEMYSFWVVVVAREGEQVTVMEFNPPCKAPRDGKVRIFPALWHFQAAYGYKSLPNFWISLSKRGTDVAGWLDGWISEQHINESLAAGPKEPHRG